MTFYNRVGVLPSAVTTTTAPSVYPIRIDDLRAELRIDGVDEDDVIVAKLREATSALELSTGRRFINHVLAETWDDWPFTYGHPATLTYAPVVAASVSITYQDVDNAQQTLADTVYGVDTESEPGRIYLKDSQALPSVYDSQPNAVTVTYTAGYGTGPDTCPPLAQAAIKMRAAAMYCDRDGEHENDDAWQRAISLFEVPAMTCRHECIKPGQLNQRVTHLPRTASTGGDPTPTIGTGTKIWAEVLTPAGAWSVRRQRVEETIDYVITTRYRKSLDGASADRLTWHSRSGDRTLEIISARDPDSSGIKLELKCREVTA